MSSMASNTVIGIITDAMTDAGLLQEGGVPNSQNIADCGRRLADIINLWQTRGLKLFLNELVTFPIVAGQTDYILGPPGTITQVRPIRIHQANVVMPNSIRRPITILAWENWMRLSQVAGNLGTITSMLVDRQETHTRLAVWNTPDVQEANNTIEVLVQVQAPIPWNFEESVQFPAEWRIALRWALADDICTGQPKTIMARCAERASFYMTQLEEYDVEEAPVRFTMNFQSGYGRRR